METRPTRLFLTVLPQNILVPSQQSLAFFSAGEAASVFQGYAGVVAGTVVRRWNGKGGGRRWGPVFQVTGAVSSGKIAGPVAGGTLQMFSGFETDLRETHSFVVLRLRRRLVLAVRSVYLVQAPPAPTPSAVSGRLPTFSMVQMHSFVVQLRAGSAGVRTGDAGHPSRDALVAQRHHSGGCQWHGRRTVSGAVAGSGQQARCERAEAGCCLDSDVLLSFRVENPSARVARVNTALHQNSHSTPARSLHDVARCFQSSLNSLGDGVVRGRGVCVLGETKSVSPSTRSGVRRSTVYESAHTQQTPLELHSETWAGLLRNQGRRFSVRWKSARGVLLQWLVLHVLIILLSHLGQGSIIRNMLGWSQLGKTAWSGVWLFRSAFQGENLFSSLAVAGDWERKGSYHTAWAVPCDSSCTCSYAYGRGPAIGPRTGERC